MKKLLFVLLLSISSVVHAQWTSIIKTDEMEIYIDSKTISQINQFRRAWFKVEFALNSDMSKVNVGSSRFIREFDCREKKIRLLSFTNFSQSNLSGDSTTNNKISDWSFVAPNTYAEVSLDIVCKSK